MRASRLVFSCVFACFLAVGLGAEKAPAGGPKSIEPTELKEWLSYIASDELQGRQIYTEGLGLAAAYISDHLAEWGVKPAGEDGTYFQTVKVLGVRTNSNASVTVEVNGQKRTFKDGEGITFPRNMGGKQVVTGDQIQFVGYGLQVPSANIDDYANVDPKPFPPDPAVCSPHAHEAPLKRERLRPLGRSERLDSAEAVDGVPRVRRRPHLHPAPVPRARRILRMRRQLRELRRRVRQLANPRAVRNHSLRLPPAVAADSVSPTTATSPPCSATTSRSRHRSRHRMSSSSSSSADRT